MNRPTPRRSALAGRSPVDPVEPAPQAPAAAAAPAVTEAPVLAAPQRRSAAGNKVSFYLSPDDAGRARAAMRHTQLATGTRSWSDFIAKALMAEVERLELEHNGGQSWPSIEAGVIPTGRPMGE